MLKTFKIFRHVNFTVSQNYSSVAVNQSPEKWDLLGAICLERKPIIVPELNEKEQKFQEYLNQVEYEKSMKSHHEVRHEQDILTAEALKKGELSDLDLDASTKQTAQDFKDACVEELAKFEFASKTTEDDKTNNTKSLNRKLNRSLIYVTEQQIGSRKYFMLPQVIREDGETMRQTAERALKLNCDGVEAQIFGNAPSGFYKYKYPKNVRKDAVGAKVFIYFARYLKGNVDGKSANYQWLDRNELEQKLPNEYYKNVQKLLVDE